MAEEDDASCGGEHPLALRLGSPWGPAEVADLLRAGPEAAARATPAAPSGQLSLGLTGIDRGIGPTFLIAARAAGVAAATGPGALGERYEVTGPEGALKELATRLGGADPDLAAVGRAIERALVATARQGRRVVPTAHGRIELGDRPLVMGVINVTPDSFSDGGRFFDARAAADHGAALAAAGADLLDIGGESTRPGAAEVDDETEWARVGPVVHRLAGAVRIPLSIDTRHASVARRAVAAGVDVVNDVSGLADPAMRRVVADTGAAAVVMHRRGTPATMTSRTEYTDLRGEVAAALDAATRRAIVDGVAPDRLVIDPGLGFAKTAAQSLELLAHVGELRSLGFPLLLGASRKSFLGWVLGGAGIEARGAASVAAAILAARGGADIVRVHDVAATVRGLCAIPPRGPPVDRA